MSRHDPGAATGQQPYPVLGACTCGHPVGVHAFNAARFRAVCSARGFQARPCGCRLYVRAGAVA